MTPYQIGILLHYYCRADDYDKPAPILRETLEGFIADGLLVEDAIGDRRFEMTRRGVAYCEALQRVGLPESRWVMTWPKDDLTPPEAR